MFLSNAFSISEMAFYQILRFNYYKKLKERWTDDVDGDCISFNLYRITDNQKFCLKDGEEISEKKSTARFINIVLI